jgi:glutamine amidotransferase
MTIAVVDYGMGNLGAIPNMLRRIGATAVITNDPIVISEAKKLILPGVGSFDTAIRNLQASAAWEPLHRRVIDDRVPVLGLCLGMQILADRSEEGSLPGLGWIPGEIVRFQFAADGQLRIPHMGWNTVRSVRPTALLESGATPRFYFAHSYHYRCADERDMVGATTYGYEFASVIARDNVLGVQFHPEKSHRFGLALLRRFIEAA